MSSESAQATSGYATVAGLRIYYEVHGGDPTRERTPMVLLPGGMMPIAIAFAPDLLPRLARRQPVIAIEPQGHFHTGDREGPMELRRMVDDVVGVLDHLGVGGAHFLGHSLGGMLALGAAIYHPRIVRGLTLVSVTYQLGGWIPELVQMQTDPTHEPSAELLPLLPTEADFAAWRAAFESSAPDPTAFDGVLERLNQMLTAWPGWTEDDLRSIEAPTLVAIGDNDFVRVEHAAEMARLIPDAQLAVLPGTTHMNIIERGPWLEAMLRPTG